MKFIHYNFHTRVDVGTTESPQWQDVLTPVTMRWSEANEELAKKEAYNGEYTIEDDGQPEPTVEPTTDEVLNAMLGVNRYA